MLVILVGTEKATAPTGTGAIPGRGGTATIPSISSVSKAERFPARSVDVVTTLTLVPVGGVYGGSRKNAKPSTAPPSAPRLHHKTNCSPAKLLPAFREMSTVPPISRLAAIFLA